MTTVSLLIATRNAERYLAEALASVTASLGTTTADVEILIADGNSSDATVEIASAHPRARIVSRADHGIYDGMNCAIAAAGGDYCLILNSDDVLARDALGQAVAQLASDPRANFASSAAVFGVETKTAAIRTHPGPLTLEGAVFGIPAINARLFRRQFLQDAGPIRTDIGLAADREFLTRLARAGGHGLSVADPLYLYRIHAGSHTISGDAAGRKRVYEAEIMLATALYAHHDAQVRDLARAAGAVAKLKRALITNGRPIASGEPPTGLRDFARGLLLAQKWRGRLSGH